MCAYDSLEELLLKPYFLWFNYSWAKSICYVLVPNRAGIEEAEMFIEISLLQNSYFLGP